MFICVIGNADEPNAIFIAGEICEHCPDQPLSVGEIAILVDLYRAILFENNKFFLYKHRLGALKFKALVFDELCFTRTLS